MSQAKPMTNLEWVGECNYISRVTMLQGNVSEMSHDKATFIRYCEMQRDRASREGYGDVTAYIEQCLNDLRA